MPFKLTNPNPSKDSRPIPANEDKKASKTYSIMIKGKYWPHHFHKKGWEMSSTEENTKIHTSVVMESRNISQWLKRSLSLPKRTYFLLKWLKVLLRLRKAQEKCQEEFGVCSKNRSRKSQASSAHLHWADRSHRARDCLQCERTHSRKRRKPRVR